MAAAMANADFAVRRLPLAGAVNCRDLGGYLTADGRRIRNGLLFRSDQFAELTDDDLPLVVALGLRTMCDLRADSERLHKPNRVFHGHAPTQHVLGFMPHGGDALIADVRGGMISPGEIESRVREMYRRFVSEQAPSYRQLLQLLSPENLPLLYHCTSGRDRTGFGTLVVLSALGVPRETIIADYVASNQFRRDLRFQIGDIDPQLMQTLTQSHPDYIAASFEEIDRRWGGIDPYLRDALALSDARRAQLQELLLEAT